MDWKVGEKGGFLLRMIKGDYDASQYKWAEQHPASQLYFGGVHFDGNMVVLDYSAGEYEHLTDWLATAGEEDVIRIVYQMADVEREIASSGGLLLWQNIQPEISMLFVDRNVNLRLIYTSLSLEIVERTEQHARELLMDLIRNVVNKYGQMKTSCGCQLRDMMDDPYLTFSLIRQTLENVSGASDAPRSSVRNVLSNESGVFAVSHDRELRTQPFGHAVTNAVSNVLSQGYRSAPVENREELTTTATQATSPLRTMISEREQNAQFYAERSTPPASFRTVPASFAQSSAAPASARPMAYGAGGLSTSSDVPTQEDWADASGPVKISLSSDLPTGDSEPEQIPVLTGHKPDHVFYQDPVKYETEKQQAEKKERPKITLPKVSLPKISLKKPEKAPKKKKTAVQGESAVELTFEEQKQRCMNARIVLGASVVVLIPIMIILFSFSNPLISVAFILTAVVVVLYMVKQGYMSLLVMPKEVKAEPQQPKLAEVFNVKMKLQSVNLASVVEVTIREREQILGSSPTQASKPTLDFLGISRRHCKISCVTSAGNDAYYIEDLNSKYGTEINGLRLQPGQKYPLHVGDTLTLAHKYKFVVHSDAY